MHSVYLGLGSNLNHPVEQLKTALKFLADQPAITLVQTSPFYQSKPHGPQDQPDFVNAVCHIKTTLTPTALLATTQAIEQQQGRVKTRHWGERTIDIDILLFDDLQLESDALTIPHPAMRQRAFVLVPLYDIAPQLALFDTLAIDPLKNQLIAI